MEKIKYYLPSIIFNITEILVIILIGVLLRLKVLDVIFTLLIFSITRMICKKAMHYKSWKLCMLWSTLQLTSLFLTHKIGVLYGVVFTIFAGIILSEKGNIKDIFMWTGNSLNKEVFNWVKFNQDNKELIKYEEKLKETDKQKYFIFKYRFKEFKSYKQIADLMDIDAQRIAEEIKTISHFIEYSIRLDN